MKPEDALKILEGSTDLITPAVSARTKFFRGLRCVSCGADRGSVIPEVTPDDIGRMRADEIVPQGKARCTACRCLFDPDTGIVIERGSITNVVEPATVLLQPEED